MGNFTAEICSIWEILMKMWVIVVTIISLYTARSTQPQQMKLLCPTGSYNLQPMYLKCLKGLSVIVHSKLHFFSKPPEFFHIFRENPTVKTYLCNNSLRNRIFLDRQTILCCWELELRIRIGTAILAFLNTMLSIEEVLYVLLKEKQVTLF